MLSKKAKYAIMALVHLAKRHGEGPVRISEIAEREHIPQKFLEAILLELRKEGMLTSRKGRSGGYALLRTPEDINLAQVMRLIDGPIASLPCATYKFYERCEECTDEERCGIRKVFLELRNESVRILKSATLANIIEKEKQRLSGNSDPDGYI
ncbi:MAG: Rrf2 family transcriptional regulator [Flavobacteriales bacterium]|nr:Rrf2 family transcriptional regulator [Flavobacteriales bacterium]